MKRKAVVAMSGGVDSSVAAALMKDAGFDVTGVMLKLWEGVAANNDSGCCSLDAAEDARRVAQVLDIPFYVFNFAKSFSHTVVRRFVDGYASGETPNPCVECNRSIKFSMLLDRARAIGADVLATGHYARIGRTSRGLRLMRGMDRSKDQSYVLYMLTESELSHAAFPVGDYSKDQIRDIAASLGLRTANKPDSQEICFVPNGDLHAFLSQRVPDGSVPGPIVDESGSRIGEHRGFAHYTLGQRRGLGVASPIPVYVRQVRTSDNTVVAGPAPLITRMDVKEISFPAPIKGSLRASVMTRYRGPEASASIEPAGDGATVIFDKPQAAAAPGQSAVFYHGEEVAGGGIISFVS